VAVTRDQLLEVAALARLGLGDADADRLALDLTRILEHMADLAAAEVAMELTDPMGPEGPTENEGLPTEPGRVPSAPLRPDEPAPHTMGLGPAEMAPEWVDGYFIVPRLESHRSPGGDGGRTAREDR
jgi:Asp-tRNA(Asn)/Glu-tRNA(Gln) amidotransferase C subunit